MKFVMEFDKEEFEKLLRALFGPLMPLVIEKMRKEQAAPPPK